MKIMTTHTRARAIIMCAALLVACMFSTVAQIVIGSLIQEKYSATIKLLYTNVKNGVITKEEFRNGIEMAGRTSIDSINITFTIFIITLFCLLLCMQLTFNSNNKKNSYNELGNSAIAHPKHLPFIRFAALISGLFFIATIAYISVNMYMLNGHFSEWEVLVLAVSSTLLLFFGSAYDNACYRRNKTQGASASGAMTLPPDDSSNSSAYLLTTNKEE